MERSPQPDGPLHQVLAQRRDRRGFLRSAAALAAALGVPAAAFPATAFDRSMLHDVDIPRSAPFRPGWFRLDNSQNDEVDLNGLAASGAIVNLWATWCQPCAVEMPSLIALAKTVSIYGINFLPIACDSGGAAAVKAFYARHEIVGLPVLTCPDNTAFAAFRASVLPHTSIVRSDGLVVASIYGAVNWSNVNPLDIRQLAQ